MADDPISAYRSDRDRIQVAGITRRALEAQAERRR